MSNNETDNPTENGWQTHIQTLMKRMKTIEIAEKIDLILYEYYFERGRNVPDWKPQPDPQWWTDYLNEIYDS